ncbi:MAG TPA: PH domain-containing protein [Candidatus Tectomicrobia bacterium]|nr:PH domain-containing protein [Candidatus Tectomicrobia bacterium]
MSERPWWGIALQAVLWMAAMSLVMGWLGRSRFRARRMAAPGTLEHPPSTLIVGVLCFGLFAGMAIVSNVVPNPTATWWTTAIFVGFALLSAPLILDYFVASHEASAAGLSYRKLLGARKSLRWSELRQVRYAPTMKWFRLETRSGDVARISAMLMGLPEFARLVLEHAPPEVIDPDTLEVLRATADGHPPSLWS